MSKTLTLDEILQAVKNSGHGFQLENGQRQILKAHGWKEPS